MSSTHPLMRVTGRLFVADLGTDPPGMTVEGGTFVSDWRAPWLLAGVVYRKPIEMRPDADVDVMEFGDEVLARRPTGDLLLTVPPEADVEAWPSKFRPMRRYDPPSIYEVKFMLGWESVDRDERIVCRQVLSVAWPRVFRVESHPEGSWTMYCAATHRSEDVGVLHRIVAGPDGEPA